MAHRYLLHKTQVDEFALWLEGINVEVDRKPRGNYQILGFNFGNRWHYLYSRNHMPEHVTVPEPAYGLVRRFIHARREKHATL